MIDSWECTLTCVTKCNRCNKNLIESDERILSAYDHEPICMECERKEEESADYAEASKEMIGQCMDQSEVMWGDPGNYCYHHFYPYKYR